MAEPALSAGSDVNGQSEGVGTHTPSDFSFLSDGTRSSSQSAMFLLRNPWVPAPSSGSKSIINSPSHRTLSEVPTHPSASPAAFNVSTLDGSWPTSTSADPPVGSADHAVRPHPAAASQSESGRLGKRKCLSFPALANVFYLGRRPGSQVAWHVSQTIRASLCEALGHSAGGSPFLETPEGHTGQVSVRRSRAFISQTKVLDVSVC